MAANTQKDILEQILSEIATMKTKLPNGELKRMEEAIRDLRDNYTTLKEDVSDIKYTLLNPEDGIIVRVNKNSEWRKDREEKQKYYDRIVTEFEKMKDWKDGVTKALWIVFTALVGIIGYILSGVMPQ
jgi:DNA-binding protein H-NS